MSQDFAVNPRPSWIRISKEFITDPKFTPTQKTIYCLLVSFANEGGKPFPSHLAMSQMLNLSPKTISAEINSLVARGALEVEKVGGKSIYTLKV
jgi:Mn-dependent DtxR family transcriptional regulator